MVEHVTDHLEMLDSQPATQPPPRNAPASPVTPSHSDSLELPMQHLSLGSDQLINLSMVDITVSSAML